MKNFLSPKDLAEAIGVSESSIRRWSDSGRLTIQRTSGGHRKIALSEATRFIRETDQRVIRPDRLGLPALGAIETSRNRDDGERLLEALLAGRARTISGLFFGMYLGGRSVAEICDGPMHQALTAIGNLWPQEQRSVFLEHRATMLCIRGLNQLKLALPETEENAPVAMGGAPQDDPYLLPSLMASLVLHETGYEDVNLGPNTPLDVLADAVEDEKPPFVWLAISAPLRSRQVSKEIHILSELTTSYGGNFVIGGRSVGTYQGEPVPVCQTMADLARFATEFRDRLPPTPTVNRTDAPSR